MSMSSEPATLANAPALEPAPPTQADALNAALDERMSAAEDAAWAEAGPDAEWDRQQAAEVQSLVHTPVDQASAALDEIMQEAQIAADSERDLAAEELAGVDHGQADDLTDEPAAAAAPADVKAELERARAEVKAFRSHDQAVLTELQNVTGFAVEANGRSRYSNLEEKVLTGRASQAEQSEIATYRAVHAIAGPVYRQAEQQVLSRVTDTLVGALNSTVKAGDAEAAEARAVYAAGVDQLVKWALVGRRAAMGKSQSTAPASRSSSTATRPAAPKASPPRHTSTQASPARVRLSAPEAIAVTPSGPPKGSWLAKALDPKTGLPTDEFDREVKAGRWLGVDLART